VGCRRRPSPFRFRVRRRGATPSALSRAPKAPFHQPLPADAAQLRHQFACGIRHRCGFGRHEHVAFAPWGRPFAQLHQCDADHRHAADGHPAKTCAAKTCAAKIRATKTCAAGGAAVPRRDRGRRAAARGWGSECGRHDRGDRVWSRRRVGRGRWVRPRWVGWVGPRWSRYWRYGSRRRNPPAPIRLIKDSILIDLCRDRDGGSRAAEALVRGTLRRLRSPPKLRD
jgi:hypothetical protein